MNGPTLNETYNQTLAKWQKEDSCCKPECEECSKDLTGESVVRTDVNWLCTDCAEVPHEDHPLYREDFECGNYVKVSCSCCAGCDVVDDVSDFDSFDVW